jgi:general secretion pathway protein E
MVTAALNTTSALKDFIKKYLEKRGYKTTEGVKVLGKSGAEHTFDMLARRDAGFASHSIGVALIPDGDEKTRINFLHNCANRAYDVGLAASVIIATTPLSQEAQRLAQHQRMKIVNADEIQTLLTEEPAKKIQFTGSATFETRSQLIKALENMNYRIEREVKLKGKSGMEYTFDIIAYEDDPVTGHRLVIDFLHDEVEIPLERVSLFEVKSYDVGFSDKAIAVSAPMSREARQFAQKYAIQIIQIEQKTATTATTTGSQPAPAAKIPVMPAVKSTKIDDDKAPVAPAKPTKLVPEVEALELIPEVMARRLNVIPISVANNTLTIVMADPTDVFALEAISASTKMRVKPLPGRVDEVREAIDLNYKGYGEIEKQISNVSFSDEITDERLAMDAAFDAPLAQALSLIIEEAVKTRASDIHLEPEENRLRVRYRIDGILHEMMSLPLSINRALISRIKILSDMNIADHLRPQDGQFSFDAKGRSVDIRVATVPCVTGEMAVLRLLDKSRASRGLAEVGFLPASLKVYEQMLASPYGMILSSGPTGSGKTTTLYASINSLDLVGRNVITIEDPAEYRFKNINQIQVNPQAGITFAAGLRSILRLDPNIVLVGEIRDGETANIATQAALTGHLILSSVHANDAATTIARLIDLKVEPFLIATSVIGVVAQRMVRRVCPDCGRLLEAPLSEQMAYEKATGEKRTEFQYGVGCEQCSYTGYLGRTGIFEILRMTDSIRTMVVNSANSSEIRTKAITEGMVSLLKDGMLKVQAGITTPSEVLRSAYSAD